MTVIKGIITCTCGQVFSFEKYVEDDEKTTPKVACPYCKANYNAKDHETPEEAPEEGE